MKSKFSTRILSVFLAVVMIVTTIPMFTMTATADVNYSNKDRYLFAYFTGDNDGQHIRFALSSDGVNFAPLNGNAPILKETPDDGEVGLVYNGNNVIRHNTYWNHANRDGFTRDPFIYRKKVYNSATHEVTDGNGYYIVGTDLHVGDSGQTGDYNNSRIYVWDVNDISKADQVKPKIIETIGWYGTTYTSNNGYIAWAPEVTYDYSKHMYMLYWSGPLYDNSYIQYVYTNDFQTFVNSSGQPINGTNQPEILYKHKSADTVANTGNYSPSSGNTIDGDITYDASTGYYYLVYKFEAQGQLYIVKSNSLTGFNSDSNHAVKFVDSRVSGCQSKDDNNKTHLKFEGPELYQRSDGKWVLITDQYAANPDNDYYMYVANSIDDFMAKSGNTITDKQSLELKTTNIDNCYPRHGAIAPITQEEYEKLAEAYAMPTGFPYTNTSVNVKQTFDSKDSLTSNYSDYYKNVVYSSNGNGSCSAGTGPTLTSKTNGFLGVGNYTMAAQFNMNYATKNYVFYDGNPIRVPAIVSTHKTADKDAAYIFNVYPTAGASTTDANSILSVYDRWKGGDARDAAKFDDCRDNGNSYIGKSYDDRVACNSISNKKWQHYASAIVVNAANINFGNSAVYDITGTSWLGYSAKDTTFTTNNPIRVTDANHIYVINYYDAIAQYANQIKATYNNVVKGHESEFCPESLDAYYNALSLATFDPNTYLMNSTYASDKEEIIKLLIRHIQKVIDGNAVQKAIAGPQKSRIQFGNLFDFDAFLGSSSATPTTSNGGTITYNPNGKIVTITASGDAYSTDTINNTNAPSVNSYKIPITRDKYVFEYTCDNEAADLMLFVPNGDESGYLNVEGNSVDHRRPRTYGTKVTHANGEIIYKQLLDFPSEFTDSNMPKYCYFRVGLNSATTTTVNISRIRLYKAEYENWASRAPEVIVGGVCAGQAGNNIIGYKNYGEQLPTPNVSGNAPSDLSAYGKHFEGWYTDETFTNKITQTNNGGTYTYTTSDGAGVHGCQCLYAKYVSHKLKWNSTDYANNTASFPCLFVGTEANDTTPKTADATVYDYLEMIYQTLDVDRYSDAAANLKAGKATFDAMKTTEFYLGTKPAADTSNDKYYDSAQALVDESTRALLNAMNDVDDASVGLGHIKQFNLTFNVYENGTLEYTNTTLKPYNTVVTLDATPHISGTAQAWTATTADTQGTLKAIAHEGPTNTYAVKLQANTVVNAYYVSDSAANIVTVTDQYGRTLHQFTASSVSLNGNTVTANGTNYNVPDMPYMKVTGYKVNGQAASGTVAINGATKIVPQWNTDEGGYAITIDGQAVGGTHKYDEVVTVTGSNDAYAIAIVDADGNYKVAAYGNEYTFFANRNMTFYSVKQNGNTFTINGTTITDKLTAYKLANKLPFVYSACANTEPANNRYTAFNAFSTGTEVTIIEVGTLFVKSTTIADADMTIDNPAVSKSISKTQVAPEGTEPNQYSLSAKNAIGSATGLTTRAYVKYSYTYGTGNNAQTIVAIEYGNVCSTADI